MPAGEPPPAGVLMQLIVQVLAPEVWSNRFWVNRSPAPLLSMAAKSTLRTYSMEYSSQHPFCYEFSLLWFEDIWVMTINHRGHREKTDFILYLNLKLFSA